jgi:pimeloyl-ACP methyl ester carboxylesterase
VTVPEPASEFDLLAADAAEFGLQFDQPPVVERRKVSGGDGESLSALVWGTDTPQYAFLHGGGLNAHTWDTVALALDAPLVALDLPGHGQSPWRDDARYDPATIAPAVIAALEDVAPRTDVLVGQSLGGLTAIVVAAERPDLVRRIVIVDVSPGLVVKQDNQVRSFLAGPESFETREEIVERARAFGFGVSTESVERGVYHNTVRRGDGRWVFRHHLANLAAGVTPMSFDFSSLWPAFDSLSLPIMVVRGSRGFLDADNIAELKSHQPNTIVAEIDSGHNVQEDDPLALAHILSGFIATTP